MASSILNDVIGPVMPGSSSSHTAGPYHIAKTFSDFVGESIHDVHIVFAPDSSLAMCYKDQGTDLALLMGILGLPITDERFKDVYSLCTERKLDVYFEFESFAEACHPNSMKLRAKDASDVSFEIIADSTGGGTFQIRYVNGLQVDIRGDANYLFVESGEHIDWAAGAKDGDGVTRYEEYINGRYVALIASIFEIEDEYIRRLKNSAAVLNVKTAKAIFFPKKGAPISDSGDMMVKFAEDNGLSLGEAALEYESQLLGVEKYLLNAEMDRRLKVMENAVRLGLSDKCPSMMLLYPTAGKIMEAENSGRVAVGGMHTRAAARAIAAMQVNSGQGIVCAAPTAGSSGVMPGILVTMLEDMRIDRENVLKAMWAAGAVGLTLADRGTFAAEVCGCQVEVGAAAAMGAAAVVEAAGGSARQCSDAGAIMLHNTMGLVCDLVQYIVEVPCHSRNGAFAAQAFVCADMILGGYVNSIGINGTVDAVVSCGKMLREELRCTSRGGIAAAPEACLMKRCRC